MKFKKSLLFLFLLSLISLTFFSVKVDAITIMGNDMIYFVDTNDWGDAYIYMYSSSGGKAFSWQDSKGIMTDTGIDVDGHNLYSYAVDSSYNNKYDMVVFSSKSVGKQTKNLRYVRQNVMFAPYTTAQGNGKYDGEWFIQDKSELSNLASTAEALDSNIYTSASYSNLSAALSKANEILNTTYVLVGVDGESEYDTVISDLQTAIDNLILKNKITCSSSVGGSVNLSSNYFEDSETIQFSTITDEGFEVESVTVTRVTGYNGDTPILSSDPADVTTLTVDPSGTYSYVAGTDDIYINVTYSKKTYNINTTVGELGSITPNGPVTVEYGDSKDFVIMAKDGYNVKTVTVNGTEYTLKNGTLSLTNITSDMDVVVTFEIKTYIVNIDGVDYEVTHGSKLSDLSNYSSIITKDGYVFEGFKISGTEDTFDTTKSIDSNLKLTTKFTKIAQDSTTTGSNDSLDISNNGDNDNLNVPNTGDVIVISFIGLGISILTIFGLLYYKKKKLS